MFKSIMELIKRRIEKIIKKSYQQTNNENYRLYSIHKQIHNLHTKKAIIYSKNELRENLRLSLLYLVQNYIKKISFDLTDKVYKEYSSTNMYRVQIIKEKIKETEHNLLCDKYFIESTKLLIDYIVNFIEDFNKNQIPIDEYLSTMMEKKCKL